MDKLFILIGILVGSILVVENLVIRLSAYVLIWNSSTANLALLSIFVGGLIGFGLRGILVSGSKEDYNDDF